MSPLESQRPGLPLSPAFRRRGMKEGIGKGGQARAEVIGKDPGTSGQGRVGVPLSLISLHTSLPGLLS